MYTHAHIYIYIHIHIHIHIYICIHTYLKICNTETSRQKDENTEKTKADKGPDTQMRTSMKHQYTATKAIVERDRT